MKGRYHPPLEERLWGKIESSGECWQWTATIDSCGYGRFWADGRLRGAHTVTYEVENGPVPAGLELDHLCRNRSCVRPDHLEPVTHAENVRRGRAVEASRERAAALTHCKANHPLSGDNLYLEPKTGKRRCRICRREANRRAFKKQREEAAA